MDKPLSQMFPAELGRLFPFKYAVTILPPVWPTVNNQSGHACASVSPIGPPITMLALLS